MPSSKHKKIYARDLRRADVITWTGSFTKYMVVSDAVPDPTFPGRIRFKANRVDPGAPVVGTRLREDAICTFYRGLWKDRPFIQSGT